MQPKRSTFKHPEFITSCCVLALLWLSVFKLNNLTLWYIGVTLVCCSYIIARTLYKKNRFLMHYSVFRGTEFYLFYLGGVLSICFAVFLKKTDYSLGVLCVAIIQSVFTLCRGYLELIQPPARPSIL
jgi:hypothetical protein